jgi:predicted transcriptional regulator
MNKYDKQRRKVEVQTTILNHLLDQKIKPFTVKGLSKELKVPYTSVNNVIAELRDDGYVTREIENNIGKTGRPRYLYYITEYPQKLEKLQNFLGRSLVEKPKTSQSVISKDSFSETSRENVKCYLEYFKVKV